MSDERDTLFASGTSDPFRFDERVSGVFADMIARSVPGYGLFLEILAVLARRYIRPDAHVYDLGCSLGARPPGREGKMILSASCTRPRPRPVPLGP